MKAKNESEKFICDLEKVIKAFYSIYPDIETVLKKIPANYLLMIGLLLLAGLITIEDTSEE